MTTAERQHVLVGLESLEKAATNLETLIGLSDSVVSGAMLTKVVRIRKAIQELRRTVGNS